jgi:hypothetical protein
VEGETKVKDTKRKKKRKKNNGQTPAFPSPPYHTYEELMKFLLVSLSLKKKGEALIRKGD